MSDKTTLPTDAKERKQIPLCRGVFDYFPAALAAVAEVSQAGADQHHPGQGVFWERGKSTDHADCLLRHMLERGTLDTDGKRHSAKMAWRALAILQEELEAAGLAPPSRASVFKDQKPSLPVYTGVKPVDWEKLLDGRIVASEHDE